MRACDLHGRGALMTWVEDGPCPACQQIVALSEAIKAARQALSKGHTTGDDWQSLAVAAEEILAKALEAKVIYG